MGRALTFYGDPLARALVRAVFFDFMSNVITAAPVRSARSETVFYIGFGALTLLLASLPYIYGWLQTPRGFTYTGLAYNIDDCAVYLSWMRQAASGRFFQHNQFSIDPQRDVQFNLFFLVLGGLVRLTGFAPIVIYHAARVASGALLLWAVTGLLRETIASARARQIAFALVCTAGGIGWLWGGYEPSRGYNQPVDLWQPEAITFLSVYFTPLFAAALACMVVFLTAFLRSERTDKLRDIWPAALCGFLLGNFHSYDVIHLFAVAFAWRAASDIAARTINRNGWARLIVAGLATLPTTLQVYYALRANPVFYERAFVSATWSSGVWWVWAGFGSPLALAVYAAFAAVRNANGSVANALTSRDALRLFITWAVIGVAIAHVPVAFQRKLLMGAQIPVCVLAGVALAALSERLSGDFPKIAVAFAVLVAAPSNLLWLLRDTTRLSANVGSTSHRPYLSSDEAAALSYLRDHAKPTDRVLAGLDPASHTRPPGFALEPFLSVYIPALAGPVVYNGHWSETAHYGERIRDARRFFRADTSDTDRQTFLAENQIRYIVYANALGDGPPRAPDKTPLPLGPNNAPYNPVPWPQTDVPPYLTPVFQSRDVTVYAVSR